ncbi:hypothetical protein [Virgibacillus sediminis]|uniref:Uncharacterized protein n=1 Tax=Virgibacillus sediminis TaxID=202260 RepID=A0ABV7A7K7_9BACI
MPPPIRRSWGYQQQPVFIASSGRVSAGAEIYRQQMENIAWRMSLSLGGRGYRQQPAFIASSGGISAVASAEHSMSG